MVAWLLLRRRKSNEDARAQELEDNDMAYRNDHKHGVEYYAHELPLHGDQELPSSPDPAETEAREAGPKPPRRTGGVVHELA